MARQILFLILVTCFVIEGVLSAPASQLIPGDLSLRMTPNDMEKLSKATGELGNISKMIRRRKGSLSSIYLYFRMQSTPPPDQA